MLNLRPADDQDACQVEVDSARVAAVLRRIAYDIDEPARARAVADLDQATVPGDRRAERRRSPGRASPDLRRPQPPLP